MFTGIIEHLGKVIRVRRERGLLELHLEARRISGGLKVGQSVAVNGVCLTVAARLKNGFKVQVVPETLKNTNVGKLRAGDRVNLECSLRLSDRLDGHLVLGHVDAVGKVVRVIRENGNAILHVKARRDTIRQLVEKGSIAVEGVSLTVQGIGEDSFQVALIPVTLEKTNLGRLRAGDLVNLEIDILSKYVRRHRQRSPGKLTVEFLKAQGF